MASATHHALETFFPGWRPVGSRLRQCLEKVVSEFRNDLTPTPSLLGCSESPPLPEAAVEAARLAVAREFGFRPTEHDGLGGEAFRALQETAKDPEH